MAIQVGKISPLHNLWSPTIGAGQGWTIRKCDTSVQSTTPVPPSSVPTDITIMLLVGGAGPAPVYGSAGTGGGGEKRKWRKFADGGDMSALHSGSFLCHKL